MSEKHSYRWEAEITTRKMVYGLPVARIIIGQTFSNVADGIEWALRQTHRDNGELVEIIIHRVSVEEEKSNE